MEQVARRGPGLLRQAHVPEGDPSAHADPGQPLEGGPVVDLPGLHPREVLGARYQILPAIAGLVRGLLLRGGHDADARPRGRVPDPCPLFAARHGDGRAAALLDQRHLHLPLGVRREREHALEGDLLQREVFLPERRRGRGERHLDVARRREDHPALHLVVDEVRGAACADVRFPVARVRPIGGGERVAEERVRGRAPRPARAGGRRARLLVHPAALALPGVRGHGHHRPPRGKSRRKSTSSPRTWSAPSASSIDRRSSGDPRRTEATAAPSRFASRRFSSIEGSRMGEGSPRRRGRAPPS